MTGREKLEINYYLDKIEKAKKDIVNRAKRQNIWFESDCGYEIATNFQLKYLYTKINSIIGNL